MKYIGKNIRNKFENRFVLIFDKRLFEMRHNIFELLSGIINFYLNVYALTKDIVIVHTSNAGSRVLKKYISSIGKIYNREESLKIIYNL